MTSTLLLAFALLSAGTPVLSVQGGREPLVRQEVAGVDIAPVGDKNPAFSLLDGLSQDIVYRLINRTHQTLTISQLKTFCPCLTITCARPGSGAADPLHLPFSLKPGKKIVVRARLHLTEIEVGPFGRAFFVRGSVSAAGNKGADQDLARVIVQGTLAPVVRVRYERAITGKQIAEMGGQEASISAQLAPVDLKMLNPDELGSPAMTVSPRDPILVVTPNPRLMSGWRSGAAAVPPLIATPAVITATLLPQTQRRKGAPMTFRYRMHVPPDAPSGSFFTTLTFGPPNAYIGVARPAIAASAQPPEPSSPRQAAWQSVHLNVIGEVVRELSADPQLFAFVVRPLPTVSESAGPSAVQTDAFTRKGVLTAANRAAFDGLRITSDTPLLSAQLDAAEPVAGGGARATLTVHLRPDAVAPAHPPAGTTLEKSADSVFLHAHFTCTLANGRRFVIPVDIRFDSQPSVRASSSGIAIGQTAPDFDLADAATGRMTRLSEFVKQARPVALFFFCGCTACRQTAREWAGRQRTNALPENAATVIVYQSDAAEARNFLAATGLDSKRTILLADPQRRVTERLYHIDSCPRVFVQDLQGLVCYTNNASEGAAQEALAALLRLPTQRTPTAAATALP